jgi:hypothetical protein
MPSYLVTGKSSAKIFSGRADNLLSHFVIKLENNMTKILFTDAELIKASVFSNANMRDLIAVLPHIELATRMQLRKILSDTCVATAYNSDNIILRAGKVYWSDVNAGHKSQMLAVSYYLWKDGHLGNVNLVLEHIARILERERTLLSYTREIRTYIDRIYTLPQLAGFTPFNVDALSAQVRKLGVLVSQDSDNVKLTFHKLKCGNDTEGYVSYKKVELYCTIPHLNIVRSIWYFNGFKYDSTWEVPSVMPLHPHIASNGACYGNRAEDFYLYLSLRRWDLIILLMKETLNNYSPENPFISIRAVATKLSALEGLLKMRGYTYSSGTEPARLYSDIELWREMPRCRSCENPLVDDECVAPHCRRNPEAELRCPECGTVETRVDGRDDEDGFRFECHNSLCTQNPHILVHHRNSNYCRICSEELGGSSHHMACSEIAQWHGRIAINIDRFPFLQFEEVREIAIREGRYTPPPQCPNCSQTLVTEENRSGARVDVCPSCRYHHTYNGFDFSEEFRQFQTPLVLSENSSEIEGLMRVFGVVHWQVPVFNPPLAATPEPDMPICFSCTSEGAFVDGRVVCATEGCAMHGDPFYFDNDFFINNHGVSDDES